MTALIIGISSGLIIILAFVMLRKFDKKMIYALILSGIGFLYVGFAWTDLQAFVINSVQAILFVFLSYYGLKKKISFLAIGYFLHGSWDIVYHTFQNPDLIPPHYDLFCSSLDFTIGGYLLVLHYRSQRHPGQLRPSSKLHV